MRGARFRPIYGKTTAREAVAEGFATHEGGGRAREIRLQTHFGVGSLHERALWPVVPIVAQELPRITKDIRKTISSAVANAENNFQYDIDKLIVKEAYCGKKITMKRFRPRAKGRAAPILKPYSSVTIILSEIKKMESHGTKS